MGFDYDQKRVTPETMPPQTGVDPTVDFGSNARQAESARAGASGSATPTLDAAAAGSKAAALRNHTRSVGRVRQLLASALGQEIPEGEDDASRLVLLHNSAEWIDSGQVGLQVLDRTHDSDQRAPAGQEAYFDTRATWDGPADYDETNVANNAGVTITFPESGHFDPATGNMVFVEATGQAETDLANTLIHEMQHACDGGPDPHGFERGIAPQPKGPYDAPIWVYQDFASEVRARLIDPVEAKKYGDPALPATRPMEITATRDPGDPDVVAGRLTLTGKAKTGFANDQQEWVWDDMIRDPSPTVWFDYGTGEWTKIYGYFAHHYVLDPAFRTYVDQLGATGPVSGGNAVNSIRIQALAEAMAAGKTGLTIMTLADALDGVDVAFLQDPGRSSMFWNAALRYLATRIHIYARLQASILGEVTVDPSDEIYTVVAGDTLAVIAARILGDRSLVPEILRLNPQITNGDRIEVGDQLRLPPLV